MEHSRDCVKYVIVTGGVLSGLGKGISTSSIGVLLKSKGLKICPVKIDPYLNIDAGTMNPYQHGEVFVLDDGSQVDLDLGNYERFLDVHLTGEHNITTGKVYRPVIDKQRRGDDPLEPEIKKNIAFFSDVPVEGVISAPDASTIYDVPLLFDGQGLTEYAMKTLGLRAKSEDMREWKAFLEDLKSPKKEVTIALVGKYTHLKDSYISHIEAFHHASAAARVHVKLKWVESVDLEKQGTKPLEDVDGILVPGGFGDRGIEGKIAATRLAAEHDVPFQGVRLGFQLATVGFARDVLGLKGANSPDFRPQTPHPAVDLLPV